MSNLERYINAHYDELIEEIKRHIIKDRYFNAMDIFHQLAETLLKYKARFENFTDDELFRYIFTCAKYTYYRGIRDKIKDKELIETLMENYDINLKDEVFNEIYCREIMEYIKCLEKPGANVAYKHIFEEKSIKEIADEEACMYYRTKKQYQRFIYKIQDDPYLFESMEKYVNKRKM